MSATGGTGGRRRRGWVRPLLVYEVVIASMAIIALVVVYPERVGLGPSHVGRTPAPGEAGWQRRAPAPIALSEVAVAAAAGRLWVAGGLDQTGAATDRVLVYDPRRDAWADGPRLPHPVHHAAMASDGHRLWLVGGFAGSSFATPTADVLRLDVGATSWTPEPSLSSARAAGAAAWDGVRLVYGAGVRDGGVSDDIFVLEPAGWRLLVELPSPREHLAATSSTPGSVDFLGGRLGGLEGNVATVERVDAAGNVRAMADLPTKRGGVAAFAWPGLGSCVAGGEGVGGTFGQVECVGENGTTTLPGLTVPRHGLGAGVIDGIVYVVLGGREPGLAASDVVESLVLPVR